MYGNASDLCAFRLMPLEPFLLKPIEARWSFQVVDARGDRLRFGTSRGATSLRGNGDFGDGQISNERHPQHRYEKGGEFTVILSIEGPAGKSRLAKVWDCF